MRGRMRLQKFTAGEEGRPRLSRVKSGSYSFNWGWGNTFAGCLTKGREDPPTLHLHKETLVMKIDALAMPSPEEVIAERMPVLPVLCMQLRQTAQQMDESVMGVCTNFVGISRRAKEGVARTAQFLGSEGSEGKTDGRSLAALLESAKTTLHSVLARAAKVTEQSTNAVKRLDGVTAYSKQIDAALVGLNDMAIGNKLVAINARIEAARLGAQAAGFNVVADEILAQTRLSTSIVDNVRKLTNELNEAAATTIEILQSTVKGDHEALEESRQEVEHALGHFGATLGSMRGYLDESSQESEKLSDDIDKAIRGLQFQDRTNQRIQHVIEALEDMQAAMTPYAGNGAKGDSEAVRQLRERYTMAEEHSEEAGKDVVSGDLEFL